MNWSWAKETPSVPKLPPSLEVIRRGPLDGKAAAGPPSQRSGEFLPCGC